MQQHMCNSVYSSDAEVSLRAIYKKGERSLALLSTKQKALHACRAQMIAKSILHCNTW